MRAKYLARTLKSLTKQLEKINVSSERLLDEMSLHPENLLKRRPVAGAWTPLQTLHHIVLVERGSLNYLLYKFGSDDFVPPAQTPRTRLNGKAVVISLLSPMKFKSPEAVDSEKLKPAHLLSLDTLAHNLREVRVELHDLLHTMPPEWQKAAVYRHIVGGRMSLLDMMRFLRAHQTRHTKQIKRGLAQNARYYRRQEAS